MNETLYATIPITKFDVTDENIKSHFFSLQKEAKKLKMYRYIAGKKRLLKNRAAISIVNNLKLIL